MNESDRPQQRVEPITAHNGTLIPFVRYLQLSSQLPPRATHWSASTIAESTAQFPHGERGTVALVPAQHLAEAEARSVEAAPGISLTLQIVAPLQQTHAHRHAFWHLYIVVSGEGVGHVRGAHEQEEGTYRLASGDVLYIPAWAAHHFVNANSTTALTLYVLQNLPQLAALGTLVREAQGGGLEHVYRPSSGATQSP